MNAPEENPFSIPNEDRDVEVEAVEASIVPDEKLIQQRAERLNDLPPNTVVMVKLIGWTLALTIVLLAVVLCAVLSENAGNSEIRSYEAVKFEVLNPPSHRMLGAIRVGETDAWFFKVVGEMSALTDETAKEIKTFVTSVKMDPRTSKPSWRTPPNWQSDGPSQMRFATLRIPSGEKTLELSVSSLDVNGLPADDFLLRNINRWRGQLKLDTLDSFELSDQTSKLAIDGVESTWIDYTGRFATSSMPMASQAPTPPRPQPNPGAPRPAATALQYKVPGSWKEEAANGFRKASFQIPNDVDKMEVSIIDLPGDSGGLVANIRRWRGQAGLPSDAKAISDEDILAAAEKMDIDGNVSYYVNLSGPEKAILGAIVDRNGFTWFVKLTG
ncbi:MAG: hypothetical protein ACI9G1_003752, partial [Pirellulaceae bacterium]